MASFDVCYDFMMDNEDPKREYAIVPDVGGSAIAGVNSKDWPIQFQKIARLPADQRGPLVAIFYQQEFWNAWYAQLTSDEVAKRVFDAAVNCGPRTAIEILQRTINQIALKMAAPGNHLLIVDEGWGPHTVESANALDPAGLVPAFCAERALHYQAIVAKNPADAKYLQAWLERAMK